MYLWSNMLAGGVIGGRWHLQQGLRGCLFAVHNRLGWVGVLGEVNGV